MNALEDAQILIQEKENLQALVDELHKTISQVEKDVILKENTIKELNTYSEEAKVKAKKALIELDEISNNLLESRNELANLESKSSILQREKESIRREIEEMISLKALEQSSLDAMRTKQEEAKFEMAQWQESLDKTKTAFQDEDKKHRYTKVSLTDHIRALQTDHLKLQNEILSKQRTLEELERTRVIVEEDIESRKRDLENDRTVAAREVQVFKNLKEIYIFFCVFHIIFYMNH